MPVCHKCGCKHDRIGQRRCRDCHTAYMREYRRRKQKEVEAPVVAQSGVDPTPLLQAFGYLKR